jgi:hypothetical protein
VPDVPVAALAALVHLETAALASSGGEAGAVRLGVLAALVPDLRRAVLVKAFPREVHGGEQNGYDGQHGR